MGLVAALLFVIVTAGAADARTLDAMIFVPKASDVIAPAAPPRPQSAIDTSRVPALGTPGAQKALAPFLGKIIDKPLLDGLRDAVQAYFATLQQPFVTVVIPAQDITGGVLQVVVTQGRLGTVRVAGNKWFDAAQYSDAIHTRPGQLLDDRELAADVDWLNRNQYRQAALKAAAGSAPGTTDLTILTQDRFPVSFNTGIDNTGNASTGLTRLSTGFDWGNALFRGDDLYYQYTTTPDGTTVQQHTAGYTTWLPWRASVSLSGTYATTQAATSAFISSAGLTGTGSLRYVTPLRSNARVTQQLTAGSDYKSTNNNLLFGGVSVFPTTTKIYEFMASYAPTLADRLGSTSATLSVFLSPGGWGNANSDVAFGSQQPGARARYTYANASLTRAINLPAGAEFQIRMQAQISTANLLSSEQLNFGYPSVRGFPSSFATRDEGVLLSAQLSPRPFPLRIPQALRIANVRDAFAPFAFVDFGTGWNHQDIGGASSYVRALTFGPGFTYQFGRSISGRFDYGFVVQRYGLGEPGGQADLGVQFHT